MSKLEIVVIKEEKIKNHDYQRKFMKSKMRSKVIENKFYKKRVEISILEDRNERDL